MAFLSCKGYMALKKELLLPVTINDSSVTLLALKSILLSAVYHNFTGTQSQSGKPVRSSQTHTGYRGFPDSWYRDYTSTVFRRFPPGF